MADVFIKRKLKHKNLRKRNLNTNEESEGETVIFKKEKKINLSNPLIQTSKKIKIEDKKIESDTDSNSDTESLLLSYRSKKTAESELPKDMGATATLKIETETDRDAQAIYENALKINKELKGKEDDKIYRGAANYTQYYEKRDTALGNASSGMVRRGPIRAPSNLRATVRWDYQPDICKDYKETGFCGFGDSCKFLHDRSDYKFGWQLETEEQNFDDDESSSYVINEDDDHLPFKCFMCRESFKDPVMTKCNHYFCEKCALNHYRKSTRCFICDKQTQGIFTPAKKIIEKLKSGSSDCCES